MRAPHGNRPLGSATGSRHQNHFLYDEDKSFFDNHKDGERITIIFSTCMSLNVYGMPPIP